MMRQVRWLEAAWIVCAVLLDAPLLAVAQSTAKPVLAGVAHVALRVSDVDAELSFFNKLGYEKSSAIEEKGKTAFVFVKINDTEFIEVHPRIPVDATAPQPLGFNHICFVTNDANALHAQWAAAGLNPTPVVKSADGTLEFGAKDPAGRLTEALEFTPDSMAMKDKGQHISAQRVSVWLAGLDMPVPDLKAGERFFEAIGFSGGMQGTKVRLTSPGNPDLRMVLSPPESTDPVHIMFSVDNVQTAAAQMTSAGLKPVLENGHILLKDPDGNTFIFQQVSLNNSQH